MFKRILVTTDGSAYSRTALPYAAGLARALGGEVLLLYVTPQVDAYLIGLQALPTVSAEEREALNRAGRRALQEAAMFGVPARQLLREAQCHDVPTTIADTAHEEGADVVVMASHGRSGLSHLLLGSVAEQVMQRATVPVLLVRQPKGQATEQRAAMAGRSRVTR